MPNRSIAAANFRSLLVFIIMLIYFLYKVSSLTPTKGVIGM